MRSLWLTVAMLAPAIMAGAAEPLKLHPDNPRYFLFRGKPAVLIASGEHYGAVLNGEFDYRPYLKELAACGFNLTRTFAGAYREVPSSFNIEDNTLAPPQEKYVSPWRRTDQAGSAEGGRKFDLAQWNDAYFTRLKDFLKAAGERGVVVELTLLCTIYDDALWKINPLNPANIVNEVESGISRKDLYTTKYPKHLALQEAFVRKLVTELKDVDNIYYEICNEPYFGGVSVDWNDRIAAVIAETEKAFPQRHLIAQNISNGSQVVKNPNPLVSILNFHYSTPPDSVKQNYDLKRAIGDDETGFKGIADQPYRCEGWDFLIAGGAVYSNLDYSFTPKLSDGTYQHKNSPGGGGPKLRAQLQTLKQFIDGFDFVHMKPDNGVIKAGVPEKASARALVDPGKQYAIYIRGGTTAELSIELPAGEYRLQWLHPRTGEKLPEATVNHAGGVGKFQSPDYQEDVALRIVRK